MEVISRDGTTAQIDPLRFCQWLLKEVQRREVTIYQPVTATAIIKDAEDVLCGVRISKGDEAESETECKAQSILPNYTVANYLQQYHVVVS